jgi:hypothetical protein
VRILIITHSYTPELTPRAFRWTAIAQSFSRMGHVVDVVCARSPEIPAHEFVGGVEVHRVRDLLIRRPARLSAGQARRTPLLYRFVRWVYGHTWRKLYWPDSACGWFFPSVRLASRLLADNRYDWLISVSHPFTGHLVGLVLKRRNPKLRWLVDIGDPFCLMEDPSPNNAALYRRLSLRADHAVLREAEVVSVTTSGTRDAYAGIFPEAAAKIYIVPPMLSLPTGVSPDSIRQKSTSLRLVYVGTLYRTLRSPAPLLELFERLVALLPSNNLELHFLGHINDCADLFSHYEHWVGSRIFVHGVVSRELAQEHMDAAHILINLGNRSSTQLPSKVIEYVAMGKPILNLVTIREDSSAEVLSTYPAALTVCIDSSAIPDVEVQKIASFVAEPPEVNASSIRDWLAPYTEQSVSQGYMRLLLSGADAAHEMPRKPNTKFS